MGSYSEMVDKIKEKEKEPHKISKEELSNLHSQLEVLEKTSEERRKLVQERNIELAQANQKIKELEESLKKTSFVNANNVTNEKTQQCMIDNAKFRILLQVRTKEVRIEKPGRYLIYSDPIGKVLELRDGSQSV